MTTTVRRAMACFLMILIPGLYLALVFSIVAAAASGIQVDWGFTRWFLVIAGVFVLITEFLLVTVFRRSRNQPEEQS